MTATVIDTGGSTPRLAGAVMAVTRSQQVGTIGGGAFERHVMAAARALLLDAARSTERIDVHLVRDLGMCCGGRMEAFLNKIEPDAELLVFGAGHTGTELAHLAARAGFHVTVVDGRAEWADAGRFPPEVTVLDAEPEDHLRRHPPAASTFCVVTTHDHALDEALIRALSVDPPHYVGLIGSRGKWARFRARLTERGVSEAFLEAVRCPVGLDIGATTPAEIAVSILGELIAWRRQV